jgi:hypothetical protein
MSDDTTNISSVPEFPGCTLQLINAELQFVVGAGRHAVFEFQSGDDDRLKHLEKQKARLEAAVKALKGVPSVHWPAKGDNDYGQEGNEGLRVSPRTHRGCQHPNRCHAVLELWTEMGVQH